MAYRTARIVTARTTCDDAGRACDVVTGVGATPELALAALQAKAEEAAQKEARQREEKIEAESPHPGLLAFIRETAPPDSQAHSRSWQFEVVDVRFTPGPIENGNSGWLAYGTLTWKDEPEQASASRAER